MANRRFKQSQPTVTDLTPAGKAKTAARQPFDPLAPYDTVGDFNTAVKGQAQAQYQPQLDEVQRQAGTAQRKHAGREREIKGDYGFYGNELSQAFDETRAALNDLISRSSTSDAAGQGVLAAALARSNDQDQRTRELIGGGVPGSLPPEGIDQAAQVAGSATRASGQNLTNSFGQILGAAGRDQALAGLGRVRANETEAGRYRSEREGLRDQRSNIFRNVPNIMATVRNALQQQAAQAQNQRFTQRVAGQELKLKGQNQDFTQGLAQKELGLKKKQLAETTRVDTANIQNALAQTGISARQVQNEAAKVEAAARSAGNTNKAKRVANGVAAFNEYMKPTKGEYLPGSGSKARSKGRPYHRDPEQAYKILIKQIGLSPHQAIKIIHSSTLGNFSHYTRRRPDSRTIGRAAASISDINLGL